MSVLTTAFAGFGAVTGFGLVVGYVTKPVRKLVSDLGPLTERNSDGQSVFDEVRSQQKSDGITLKNLADEFPKNGVPTRSAVDAVTLAVAQLLTKQQDIAADVADVRAAQSAHIVMHMTGNPSFPPRQKDKP